MEVHARQLQDDIAAATVHAHTRPSDQDLGHQCLQAVYVVMLILAGITTLAAIAKAFECCSTSGCCAKCDVPEKSPASLAKLLARAEGAG